MKLKKTSLSIKLPLLFIISILVIMIIVVLAVHERFYDRMIGEYTAMAEGVTQLVVNEIDGDKADEYMEKNFELEEYREIVDYMYTLKDNYPDVLYLYVARFEEDGGHMIIDLDNDDVENGESYAPGYVYELDEPFASQLPEIMKGEETPGYDVHTEEDGYVFSYIRPIYDSKGNYACSACVDFSLDQMAKADNAFTLRLLLMILIAAAVILAVDVLVVRIWVADPINKLSRCADRFAYDTEEDRRNNIELLEELEVRSKDEIGEVYEMLLSVTRDSYLATSSLTQAKQDILDKEEKINVISRDAYRDKLTQVGNKAAFENEKNDLRGEYGFVMFDLNDLKLVNDSCGHDKGDLYIKGCCRLICDQYDHSPVFRLGGDEFVVFLWGEDYMKRERHLEEIRAKFAAASAREDAEPWEKLSAAAGMAVRREGETADDVLKRADEDMYREKREFHERNGNKR